MIDEAYCLEEGNNKNIIDLINYTKNNALRIDLYKLKDTLERLKSDKNIDEILELIAITRPARNRVVYRRQMDFFPALSDHPYLDDAVEIAISAIYSESTEYFIFAFLDKDKMSEIKEKYLLRKI